MDHMMEGIPSGEWCALGLTKWCYRFLFEPGMVDEVGSVSALEWFVSSFLDYRCWQEPSSSHSTRLQFHDGWVVVGTNDLKQQTNVQ